jgi:hypothetical protein
LEQLADIILGVQECPLSGAEGQKCEPATCVDALGLEKLRPFFQRSLPKAFMREREKPEARTADLEAQVRRSLGVWYATSFLLNIYTAEAFGTSTAEAQVKLLQTRMRAVGKEALQWFEDSFLTHVLVYFRSPQTELVQHYTAALDAPGQTRKNFSSFLEALQDYIFRHGTTVRGDAHLKRVSGSYDPLDPLREARVINESFEDFSPLKLPLDRELSGDEGIYGQVLLDHFGSIHPPAAPGGRYGQLHLAGGCDTHYLNEEISIGAVAHMYIAFKGERKDNYLFNHVMRAMLSRLAMSFSLEEMSKQAEDIRRRAEDERRRQNRLLKRVTELDVAIHQVEEAARGVRSIIQRNVWHILKDWIGVLADLFTPDKPKTICEVEVSGRHKHWDQKLFAASLLYLVSATNNEKMERTSSLVDRWHYYRKNIYPLEANENPIWRCLQRRGMLEDDTLNKLVAGGENLLVSWKDGLGKVKPESNGASVLLLLFAIGAKADPDTEIGARKFYLHQSLNITVMANGLNHLFEAMLEHNSKQTGADPTQIGAVGRITRESQAIIGIEFRKSKPSAKNDILSICFSPITADGQEYTVITADGFSVVRSKINELIGLHRPEEGSNDTSFGVIEALGIDRNNWSDHRDSVRVTDSTVELRAADNPAEVISWAEHLNGKFCLSYKLVMK